MVLALAGDSTITSRRTAFALGGTTLLI